MFINRIHEKYIALTQTWFMQENFTPEDLLCLIYRETNAVQTLAMNDALDKDEQLAAAYDELVTAHRHLPKAQFRPTATTIQNILDYSKHPTLV
ncbi:MAG: hypothetical protein HC892_04335 [Saprospiraceae bacterium]|nr:hypothetical protein [Saprospiraceae bacterium]